MDYSMIGAPGGTDTSRKKKHSFPGRGAYAFLFSRVEAPCMALATLID